MSKEAVVTSVDVRDGAVLIDGYSTGRSLTTYNKVPLMNSFDGLITVPKEGQKVIISKTDGGTEYVEGVLTVVGSDAPDLKEQEFALQFDPSTRIEAAKDGSGGYDLTIKASGDVTIGDSANAVKLAVQNHTHEYSWTDNSGSGTTSTPNEDGTDATVE